MILKAWFCWNCERVNDTNLFFVGAIFDNTALYYEHNGRDSQGSVFIVIYDMLLIENRICILLFRPPPPLAEYRADLMIKLYSCQIRWDARTSSPLIWLKGTAPSTEHLVLWLWPFSLLYLNVNRNISIWPLDTRAGPGLPKKSQRAYCLIYPREPEIPCNNLFTHLRLSDIYKLIL
jgi:hypothetical protein